MVESVKFFSVIVSKGVLEEKYDGGVAQYELDCPNNSFSMDNYLTRVSFMDIVTMEQYCDNLIFKGLRFDEEKTFSNDFVVIHCNHSKDWSANWMEFADAGYASFHKKNDSYQIH